MCHGFGWLVRIFRPPPLQLLSAFSAILFSKKKKKKIVPRSEAAIIRPDLFKFFNIHKKLQIALNIFIHIFTFLYSVGAIIATTLVFILVPSFDSITLLGYIQGVLQLVQTLYMLFIVFSYLFIGIRISLIIWRAQQRIKQKSRTISFNSAFAKVKKNKKKIALEKTTTAN